MTEKKELIEKFDNTIKKKEKIREKLSKVQGDITKIKTNNELDLSHLNKGKTFFVALPEDYYDNYNPVWNSMIGSASVSVDTESRFTDGVYEKVNQLRFNVEALAGTTATLTSTSSNIVTISNICCDMVGDKVPEIKKISAQIKEPSAIEKKDEIAKKLEKINPSLSRDFNTAWQLFIDRNSEGWYKNAAHSMREVLSDLPQKLDPNNDILKCDWVEYSDKKPTQKSRIKFAVIGFKKMEDSPFLDVIEEQMNNARELYKKLSGLSHFRKESKELPQPIISLLESELSLLQDIIESIINLRKDFFVSKKD